MRLNRALGGQSAMIRRFFSGGKSIPFSSDFIKGLSKTALTETETREDVEGQVSEYIEPDIIESKNGQVLFKKKKKATGSLIYSDKITPESWTNEAGVLKTKFGNLEIPEPFLSEYKNKFGNIYYLHSQTKVNFIQKIFKEDKTGLILFSPNIPFNQSQTIFKSASKRISEFYFPEMLPDKASELFSKSPEEMRKMYHLNVGKLIDLRRFLNRMVMVVNNDFTIRAEGCPPVLTKYLAEYFSKIKTPESTSFYKHDMLVPLPIILSLFSAKSREEKGMMFDFIFNVRDTGKYDKKKEIFNDSIFAKKTKFQETEDNDDFLDIQRKVEDSKVTENLVSDKRVYSFWSVFPPTNKVLYQFIFNTFMKKKTLLKNRETILDVGIGTGVLPLLYKVAINPTSNLKMYGLDVNPNAIKNAQINSELHDLNLHLQLFDITNTQNLAQKTSKDEKLDKHQETVTKKFATEKKESKARDAMTNWHDDLFPNVSEFDVIISNPPWITAKPISSIDSGNYDDKEAFLTSLFQLVESRLKKPTGTFWLIYSDMSQKLGLQKEGRVEELAKSHGLIIKAVSKYKTSEPENDKVKTDIDVVKKQSNFLIYEIGW